MTQPPDLPGRIRTGSCRRRSIQVLGHPLPSLRILQFYRATRLHTGRAQKNPPDDDDIQVLVHRNRTTLAGTSRRNSLPPFSLRPKIITPGTPMKDASLSVILPSETTSLLRDSTLPGVHECLGRDEDSTATIFWSELRVLTMYTLPVFA